MSRVEAAAADRLPWLPDEPAPRTAKRRRRSLLPWAAVTLVLVAGGAFWIGVDSARTPAPSFSGHIPSSTTVRVPAPRTAEQPQVSLATQPQVQPFPEPQVRPSPVREVHISAPRAVKAAPQEAPAVRAPESQPAPAEITQPRKAQEMFVPPRPWDPRVFQGASGRIVQIGAFGSTRQAKRGWWYMVRAYPAVAHLPAVVRTSRNSKGRTFFRFQVGTTSQAHSEVLCQRMERIALSCAVVGLPWKAKVER